MNCILFPVRRCYLCALPESLTTRLRHRLLTYLEARLPVREQELLFHRGLASLSKYDLLERPGRRHWRRPPFSSTGENELADEDYDDSSGLCAEEEGGGDARSLYLSLLCTPARFRYLELAPCQRVADTVAILDSLLLLLSEDDRGRVLNRQNKYMIFWAFARTKISNFVKYFELSKLL